jgi:outer membrane protein, heavy metal efflux system
MTEPVLSRRRGCAERRFLVRPFARAACTGLAAATLVGGTGCVAGAHRTSAAASPRPMLDAHPMAPPPSEAEAFDPDGTFDDYVRHALAHNPQIRAAFERWKAAVERIPQARSLSDPTLSFEYFLDQMDTRYQVSLTQMFPAFGKRGLREDAAAAEAEAAMHAFEAERLILFDRMVRAFHEYQYLHRATQVTEENHHLLSSLEQVVTTRYQAGLAPFSDLIKIQVEKDRLASELGTLRDARAARSAGLAALLHVPVFDVLPWPTAAPSGPAMVDVEGLADLLEDLNPELKASAAMIAAGTYREKLARKNYLPNFMLGASWMVMPGMEGKGDETDVGLMAGITIPIWWGKTRAEVREAGAMLRAATHDRDNMKNMLKAELSMAVFRFRDAERRIGLFTGSLIPKAMQALEVSKQEFSAGEADFMTLIDAQRTWLEFRLMLERATADREIALGEIGYRIGKHDLGVERKRKMPEAKTRNDETETRKGIRTS